MPEATTAAVTAAATDWSYTLGLTPLNGLVRVRKEDMLPIASADVRGGIRIGAGFTITGDVLALATHSHTIANVTGLEAALTAKADAAATTTALAGKADAAATTTALAGKAATAHTHVPANITMDGQRLLGRGAAGSGAASHVTLGSGLSLSAGNTLSAGGLTTTDKGTGAAASTQTFDVSAAGHQKLTVGGALTMAFTNWPAGFGEVLIELVNGGAHTVTWPTIKWLKPDGSYVTTFGSTGVVLNSTDTDFVLIWSPNGGTTLYGKVMR